MFHWNGEFPSNYSREDDHLANYCWQHSLEYRKKINFSISQNRTLETSYMYRVFLKDHIECWCYDVIDVLSVYKIIRGENSREQKITNSECSVLGRMLFIKQTNRKYLLLKFEYTKLPVQIKCIITRSKFNANVFTKQVLIGIFFFFFSTEPNL